MRLIGILLFIAVLVGAALWFMRGGSAASAVEGFANKVPRSAVSFVAGDARSVYDREETIKQFEQALLRDASVKEMAERFASETGVTVPDLARWFDPVGFTAMFKPDPARGLSAIVCIAVREPEKVKQALEKAIKTPPTEKKVGSFSILTYGDKVSFCIADGYAYFSDRADTVEAILVPSGERLTASPLYQEAQKKILGGRSQVFGFADLGPILTAAREMSASKNSRLDDVVQGFRYAAGGTMLGNGSQSEAFLALDPASQAPLLQAMLAPPSHPSPLSDFVPPSYNFYTMLDLAYLIKVGFQIARLDPVNGAKMEIAPMLVGGYLGASVNDFDDAFTGDVAVALDFKPFLEDALKNQTPTHPLNSLIMVGLKDGEKAEKLKGYYLNKGHLSTSSTKSGALNIETLPMLPLVAMCRVDKPHPALLLAYSLDPRKTLEEAVTAGNKSLSQVAMVKKVSDPASTGVIFFDFRDMARRLLESGYIDKHPELSTVRSGLRNPEALAGAAGTRVEKDGLRMSGDSASLLLGGGMTGVVAAILVPNFTRARGQGQATACKSNEKNIGTACEMWSTDNKGRYPTSLSQLTPNYLRRIPTCPAAGRDTYSASYQVSAKPDNYTFFCTGHSHPELEANYPQYNSQQGLVER